MPQLSTILIGLFTLYVISVAIFLIRDNRSPQSTFAWMFLLVGLPVIGVLVYLFFGRGWRAFSQENKLAKQNIDGDLAPILAPLHAGQEQVIARLQAEDGPAYKQKLLRMASVNASAIVTGYNRVEILQDAQEKYPRLLADLGQAQQSIHMEYFIWEADPFTEQLKQVLIERARAGVAVRILYDALGSITLSRAYIRALRAGGVEIEAYLNAFSPFKLHTIGYRNHRKIVVIDGRIGYVGGLNMSEEHLTGGKQFASWRDTHLRLTGESVALLQAIFTTSWYNTKEERLAEPHYFPPVEPSPAGPDYLPIQIITSGPDSEWAAIRQLYFLMILDAEDHVYIQSPFFIPDSTIAEALKAAALAGVDVRLMCAPRGAGNQVPYWAANTYFTDMARAGVRIFLYQKGYFHAKTISIDSAVCSVGTANMDIRSFSINYEVNPVIYDEGVAGELEADFVADLADCREFDLAVYEASNPLVQLRDSLARLASPLL
ncbi:MAG: cardiolipin synthase [Caldilineaceae bacterium]|nr:cardiolipin synthase [Caldilineaceae bacterium]MBP8108730.1 cardiolipin synthase [Caldilineaceae bacterium]MBP8124661.1 cardiolipin synthase [Caldilineaceae bacterium]MBP9073913.1 cardiolipin synthase [Caldilineaceae bacterium]